MDARPTRSWAAGVRRHWPVAAAGALTVGALTFSLLVSGGAGAGARLGAASPSPGLPTASAHAPAATPTAAQTEQPASTVPESDGAPSPKGSKKKSAKVTIPTHGPGTFVRAKVNGPVVGAKGAPLLRYAVRVEKKLPYDAEETARAMQTTLSDPRSWIGSGRWRLELVSDPAKADFVIYLATPGTVDRYCYPLRTYGRVSCRAGNKVVLNAWRWAHGADAFGEDVSGYRQYLVNHEVGHRLGHGHVACPGKGKRAPVMMQQTKSIGACQANPWPDAKRTSIDSPG